MPSIPAVSTVGALFDTSVITTGGLKTQVERIGWPDQFVEHGRPDILREKHGITVENAIAKALKHLPARKPRALAG